MKLLTHNLLTSRFLKNVNCGYPLKLAVEKVDEVPSEYNPDFVKSTFTKIDYKVLREAAQVCGQTLPDIPAGGDVLPDNLSEDQLKVIHNALFNIDVITGTLTCPETGRKFPITNGIPNMLCNEDE